MLVVHMGRYYAAKVPKTLKYVQGTDLREVHESNVDVPVVDVLIGDHPFGT